MVVSRRKPIVSAPASALRTSSTQAVPRTTKPKAPQSSSSNTATLESANGHEKLQKPPPAGSKSKPKKKKKKHPSLLTYLRDISLMLMTIYAFLACPDSPVYTSPSSPFFSHIRSTSSRDTLYRNLPITPIPATVLPPPHPLICKTVLTTHNKIIVPFQAYIISPLYAQVSQATSNIAYSDTFAPYTLSVSDFYYTQIVPTYTTRIVPFVNHHILPQYRNRIVPFYTNRVLPFVNTRIVPIWADTVVPKYLKFYNQFILPYWKKYVSRPIAPYVQAAVRAYGRNIAPVVSRLVRIISNLVKILHKGWSRAQPHLERFLLGVVNTLKVVYQKFEPRLRALSSEVSAKLGEGLRWIGVQRKVYVDPHVKQIWVKVKELSGSNANAGNEEVAVRDTDYASVVPVVSPAENIKSVTEIEESLPIFTPIDRDSVPTPSNTPETAPEPTFVHSLSPTDRTIIKDPPVIPTSVAENEASIKVEYDSVIPGVLSDEAASLAASVIQESLFAPPPTSSATETEAELTSAVDHDSPSPAPIPDDQLFLDPEGFVDLDEFLAGLGIDLNDAIASPTEPEATSSDSVVEITPSPSPSIKTNPADMNAEERADFMTERRIDITSRHSRWESELEALIEEKIKEISTKVSALRDTGVAKVLDQNGTIQIKAEEMVKEGEKLLKGVAGWIAAHKDAPYAKRSQSGDLEKEKTRDRELFDKLLAKVEERFRDKVGDIEDEVREWYMDVRNREVEEVLLVEREVQSLAERAQADIGLDYAWLDDVTYQDWQRYHDLVRRSERFSDIARSLQNSTHESSPEDPMVPTLEDLRAEVQDIVNAFQSRMRSYRQSAEELFTGSAQVDEDGTDDVGVGADTDRTPKNDGFAQEPAAPVLSLGSHGAGDESQRHEPSSDAIPPVLLGRSEEEIAQALGRAAVQADGRRAKSNAAIQTSYGSGPNELPPVQSTTAQVPVHVEL